MNKESITRVSLEEWAKIKDQTDWARIDAMTEEEIEQNALNDPDNQPLTDEFWDEAEVIFPEVNVMVKRSRFKIRKARYISLTKLPMKVVIALSILNFLTMDYRNYITIEPDKRGGKPCVRGLRITVYEVLEYLSSEMTEAEILEDFPDLTQEDLKACIAYAADRERRFMTAPIAV